MLLTESHREFVRGVLQDVPVDIPNKGEVDVHQVYYRGDGRCRSPLSHGYFDVRRNPFTLFDLHDTGDMVSIPIETPIREVPLASLILDEGCEQLDEAKLVASLLESLPEVAKITAARVDVRIQSKQREVSPRVLKKTLTEFVAIKNFKPVEGARYIDPSSVTIDRDFASLVGEVARDCLSVRTFSVWVETISEDGTNVCDMRTKTSAYGEV